MKRTLLFPVLIVALACQGEGEPVGDARGELIASGFGGTGTGISSGSGGGSSSSSGSSASGVGSRTGVFTPAGGLSTRPGTSLPSTPAWRSCDRRRLIGHLRYADECPAPGGDWLADDRLAVSKEEEVYNDAHKAPAAPLARVLWGVWLARVASVRRLGGDPS